MLYQGRCIGIPAHTGINDTVFGSLAVYKVEGMHMELSEWIEDHGKNQLMEILRAVLDGETDSEEIEKLKTVMDELMEQL